MQRRVIRPIIGSLLAFCILHQPALVADEKSKEAGKADASQIQKLIRQLEDQDFKKREEASKKLVEIGPAALAELEKVPNDSKKEVRERAQKCINRIKNIERIPDQVRRLHSPYANVRGLGAMKLAQIGSDAIPALMKALEDKNKDIRQAASRGLIHMSEVASPAFIPDLIKLLGDPDEWVRGAAHSQLARIGSEAVPALRKALQDKNKVMRATAAETLCSMGPQAAPAVPDLMDALNDTDNYVAERAAVALGFIGPKAKGAVPKLLKIYQDEKKGEHLRFCAGSALGNIGPAAEPAVPTFFEYLKDKRKPYWLRAEAARALPKIGAKPEEVVRTMRRILADKEDDIRAGAIAALGKLGPKSKVAIPELIRVLEDKEETWEIRFVVITSLGDLGPLGKDAVPDLIAILTEDIGSDLASSIQIAAIRTLGQIGPDAKEAVDVLKQLDMSHPVIRRGVEEALVRIEGKK